jgi:transcriptional regulator with XRE-family HTH domain
MDAGITPETLSRLLTGESKRPAFQTIVNVTHAAGQTVGWLLEERGYTFNAEERTKLREAAVIIRNATRREL